jgi:NTE family protein
MEAHTAYSQKERENNSLNMETVLVMQGGGSLGAYECGVYKTLAKHDIRFDIVSGTSIGAVNAAIIATNAGCDDTIKKSARELEKFWLELAEALLPFPYEYSSLYITDELRALIASIYSATYGNPKAFFPIWTTSLWRATEATSFNNSFHYFSLFPYPLFDITPLKKTLGRYIDFAELDNKNNNTIVSKHPRLIVTSTDVQTSQPVIFDSNRTNIEIDDVIASTGFPFYGISWTQKNGRYLWDGSLLNNTPLREVIDASPIADKKVYLVNIFPHYQRKLPQDMFQVWHRARDIIYTDKTDSSIRLSKIISRYLSLLNEMHDLLTIIAKNDHHLENDARLKERFTRMENEYSKLAVQRGAIIKEIVSIERPEKTHYLFEDADFSITTIKKLIRQGEKDAEIALTNVDISKNRTEVSR